ncbi:MAG: DNA translocase FtsK 4TM domain-containing protein [Burkholderiaceae bacterium]
MARSTTAGSVRKPVLEEASTPFGLPESVLRLLREIRWISLAFLAFFLFLILATYDPQDPGWSHVIQTSTIHNFGGRVGAWFSDLFLYLFGLTSYLLILMLGVGVVRGIRAKAPLAATEIVTEDDDAGRFAWERYVGFAVFFASAMALEASRLHSIDASLPLAPGGLIGNSLAGISIGALGAVGGTLLILLGLAAGFSLWSGQSWLNIAERIGFGVEWLVTRVIAFVSAIRDRRAGEIAATEREEQVEELRRYFDEAPQPIKITPPVTRVEPSERAVLERQTILFSDLPSDSDMPAVSLLDLPTESGPMVSEETLQYTSRLIEKKLADFNVAARVEGALPGPVITRYEIEPATGVKGSQIVNLSKDLARALSLVSIRVVETIPGKNLMGLELPNPQRQTVRLSEILGSKVYADAPSKLVLAMGKDIAGNPVVADLAKMPHLLVAGTTGSGKSVGINAMLLSILYKADPSEVRMILIDPKMLELSVYEGIPHLLAPVVTDMKQAGNALNWCVAEMERRYRLMSKLGVRNLSGYNVKVSEAEKNGEPISNPFSITPDEPEDLGRLPQIVVVIDELADLMMVVGKKVEELIARLAQKARAAGIHLILATQRPSVDVITGLIKANVPSRVAFQVSSKIDSRTILDQSGAESLLGMGDMLYMLSGSGVPIRVHGAFVADEEVHKVAEHWKLSGEPDYVEGILEGGLPENIDGGSAVGFGGLSEATDAEGDPMYDQAVAVVLKNRRASISLVQRHLRIGYNRAARLLEQMENAGMVSTMSGNGNREILVPVGTGAGDE